MTTIVDNGKTGDARAIIEQDDSGQLYLTTNADTRRPIDAAMYHGWNGETLYTGLLSMDVPEDVARLYVKQAGLDMDF